MIFLRRRLLDRRYLVFTSVLMLVALVYMAPWDHIAAVWGLWTWTNGRTWGLRIWAIPPEEYLFCILEALMAITLTYALLTRKGEATPNGSCDERNDIPTRVGRRKHIDRGIEGSDQEVGS